MACKMDQDWEGSYVYKGSCVKWWQLTQLRTSFNQFWDLLKKEDREEGLKYNYITEQQEGAKEQRDNLADIEGFCSVRFDESGNYDEIYFVITGGDIIRRIDLLATQYSYANTVGNQGTNFGPWIVYLNDPCYGCTGFRFQNFDIEYPRGITCKDNAIFNIDPDLWKAQCIWPSCTGSGTVISDWQQYCHFNFDWRASPHYQNKFGDVAKRLFYSGPICVPKDRPCTVARKFCCNEYALAHYTEEYMDHSLCEENKSAIAAGLPLSAWPYRRRRLKWVSLGVTLTNPLDEQQPFNDETFFCCDNAITGGVFKGWVTQKISAIHLTDIWDRVNSMVGGQTLRDCEYNKCKYHPETNKDEKWKYKDSVPMYVQGDSPDIMERKIPNSTGPCTSCERVNVGNPICACNFNDINGVLDEYLGATCLCIGGDKASLKDDSEKTLTMFGPLSTCSCCCEVEVKTISAYSQLHGYSPLCGGDPNDKYLTYTFSGQGIIGGTCGGYSASERNVVRTWTIDPETGVSCYDGDEGVFMLCEPAITGGTEVSCTDTSREWDCGEMTVSEKSAYCYSEEEKKTTIRKTARESLSNPNTIESVDSRNKSALDSSSFSSLPWGVAGSVLSGYAGNRVLQWSGGAGPFSMYSKGAGGVYRVKSVIKAVNPVTIKEITQYESGIKTERIIPLGKGETHDIEPPSIPGASRYAEPFCGSASISTSIEQTNQSGTCREEKKKYPDNCIPVYFTAPDCKQYAVLAFESSGTYSRGGGGSALCTAIYDPMQGVCLASNNYSVSVSSNGTIKRSWAAGCPPQEQCNGTRKGSGTTSDTTSCTNRVNPSSAKWNSDYCTGEGSCTTTSYGRTTPCNYFSFGNFDSQVDPTCGTGNCTFSDSTEKFETPCSTKTTNSGSTTIGGTEVSSTWNYSETEKCEGGFTDPGFQTCQASSSFYDTRACTATYTWQNVVEGSPELNGTWEMSKGYPMPWCSNATASDCCSPSCAYNYIGKDFKSFASGSLELTISFEAPEIKNSQGVPQSKSYTTDYQIITAEYTDQDDCSSRVTYQETKGSFNSSSSGGKVEQKTNVSLSAGENSSKCLHSSFATTNLNE
jgi:hypothetical protein